MLILNDVKSYKMKADMEMSMDMVGGPEAGTMDMDMTMEGSVDQTNMEMYMAMDMSLFMDMPGTGEESQDVTIEMYMVGDHVYMKTDVPGLGQNWIKMPATDTNMVGYNFDMVGDQLALVESYVDIEYLRDEEIDGSDCYVLQINLDIAAIVDWMGTQGLGDLSLDWDNLDIIEDMFDEISYIVWLDKDTKYNKKMTTYLLMNMSGEDYGDLDEDFGELTMEIFMESKMFDHNEPVNIVLPAEAEDSLDMFETLDPEI
jgi:hypothetical protein